MTHLRKIMLEELERRNHRQTTILSMASLSISIGLYQSLLLSEKNRLHNFFYTLLQGAALPKLVRRNMISQMKPGAVIVDVAIDQGGCVETAHATMHTDPVYYVDGVVLHYCVSNMPAAVPHTSTFGLTNATMPYPFIPRKA